MHNLSLPQLVPKTECETNPIKDVHLSDPIIRLLFRLALESKGKKSKSTLKYLYYPEIDIQAD